MLRSITVTIALLFAASACTDDEPEATPTVPPTESASDDTTTSTAPAPTADPRPDLDPKVVVEGLEVPWGIAFLPDGSALIAERDTATVQHLTDKEVTAVGTVDGVEPTLEGGLLGLAVSPSYDQDQTVYAYLTTSEDNRVVTMTFDGDELGPSKAIFTGIPKGDIHDGGRIAFGPDGKLYVTTGETGDGPLAQDPDSPAGKILRLEPDGSVPRDNPDPKSPVWTLGHRNVQGITWDDDERLWASEFGASAWDELNLIEPGDNYGWPEAEGRAGGSEFTDPVLQWPTSDLSPSGIAYLDGSLYIAGLAGERLYRIPLNGNGKVGEPEALYRGEYGRLRTVVATPDGTLWFTTSNLDGRGEPAPSDDRIFEIRP